MTGFEKKVILISKKIPKLCLTQKSRTKFLRTGGAFAYQKKSLLATVDIQSTAIS